MGRRWGGLIDCCLAVLLLLTVAGPAQSQQLTSEQLEAVRRGAASMHVPDSGTVVPLFGPPDLPLVEVTLNGRGPYRFLVDLGANVMIVRRSVADDAGMRIVLDRDRTDIVAAADMTIGGARFRDVWLGAYDELDVDGVIGYNVLRGTGVTLDYVGRQFRLGPLRLPPPDGSETLDYVVESRLPYVPARVGDRELLLNLDTGAANHIVFPAFMVDSLPLEAPPVPGPVLYNEQTGPVRNLVGRLAEDLVVGGHVIERPVVLFDPEVEDAWLGSAILVGARLELDTERQVLRLAATAPLATPPDLVIRDVSVWDGVGPGIRHGRTVVVRYGTIVQVGPSAEVEIPAGATVVDGRGEFLIPGLWDMHVHALWAADVPATFLPLFVAHGVTGVRDMGGTLDVLAQARDDVRMDRYPAPRLVASGMILDGPEPVHPEVSIAVADAADARRAVERLARADVDFLKVYTLLPAEAFEAVVAEAAVRSLPVAGHVPAAVGPVAAAEAGMRSVEHTMNELDGFCAREEPEACDPIVAAFREHGTWQVPVLAVERDRAKEQMAADPRLAYMPESLLQYWFGARPPDADARAPADGRPPAPASAERTPELPEEAWLTTLLHEAGVPILAGTDAGVPFSLPGWSLHEELELLVAAGLTPAEALEAATRGPAEYLGRTEELGTIEVGRRADLVLLRANPLDDIRNTRAIEAVILGGELLDREALDAILEQVMARGGSRQGMDPE